MKAKNYLLFSVSSLKRGECLSTTSAFSNSSDFGIFVLIVRGKMLTFGSERAVIGGGSGFSIFGMRPREENEVLFTLQRASGSSKNLKNLKGFKN